MTAFHCVEIWCNKCGDIWCLNNCHSFTEARSIAYNAGWTSKQPYDYCKKCMAEHLSKLGELE